MLALKLAVDIVAAAAAVIAAIMIERCESARRDLHTGGRA